jgi:hypothetical protein
MLIRSLIIGLAASLLFGCAHRDTWKQHYQQMQFQTAQRVVTELFVATDNKDWDQVEKLFAPMVEFDMTSLAGGKPARMAGKDIAAAWKQGLSAVNQVHHQAGNYLFHETSEGIEVFCYATATHYHKNKKKKITTFVGSYDMRVVKRETGWVIDRFKFNKKYVQ